MTPANRPGPVDLAEGLDPAAVRWDTSDLVAGVVQDVADGRVLMPVSVKIAAGVRAGPG